MARNAERVYDEYLTVLARSGDRGAFAALFRRWNPRAVRHANRLLGDADTAADAAQEAWLSALRGLARLDDPAAFPAWFLGIVGRRCADRIRKNRRGRKLATAAAADPTFNGAQTPPPGGEPALAAAIRALPPVQRAVVGLFYQDGLNTAETGRALGLSEAAVKSRLHAARETLKSVIARRER